MSELKAIEEKGVTFDRLVTPEAWLVFRNFILVDRHSFHGAGFANVNAGYVLSVSVYWFARYASDTTGKEQFVLLVTESYPVVLNSPRVMIRLPHHLTMLG